jgi:hypothetical protein
LQDLDDLYYFDTIDDYDDKSEDNDETSTDSAATFLMNLPIVNQESIL